MIQITQTTETVFSALSFQDAITMVSLMDNLVKQHIIACKNYDDYRNLPEEKRSKWNYENELENKKMEIAQLEAELDILFKLGFRNSIEGMYQKYAPVKA